MKHSRSQAKDYARENFRGVWGAIPTPFTASGDIDEAGLRSDIRYYIDAIRLDGFFFGGLIGESWALGQDERLRLQEIVLDEVAGGCQTIAHTGTMSLRDTIALTRHAQDHGADYIVCLQPPGNPSKPEHTLSFFEHLCAETDLGVTLFNNKVAGYSLTPELIARLADIDNVIAVKDAQPPAHIDETRRLAGDRIIICDPSEGRFCENILTHGDKLFMSSPAPFLLQTPDRLTIRDYTAKALAGEAEEARRLSATLEPARQALDKWVLAGSAVEQTTARHKYWAGLLGLTGGDPRPPLAPLDAATREAIRADLEACGLLTRQAAE